MKWLPGASKEFHSSVCDVSACSKCVCDIKTNVPHPAHSAPAGSESWAGPRSHGELVTEGETVKLRQQRDVTRDISRRPATCCASSPWVDARTLDLRMVFGKMNGTNKCGHYIKKKIVNIYYVVRYLLYIFYCFLSSACCFILTLRCARHACPPCAKKCVTVKLCQVLCNHYHCLESSLNLLIFSGK